MVENSFVSDNPLALISSSEAVEIAKDVLSRVTAEKVTVMVSNDATSSARFANNDVHDVEGQNSVLVQMTVGFGSRSATTGTTKVDKKGLDELVSQAEVIAKQSRPAEDEGFIPPKPVPFTDPPLYFSQTIDAGGFETQGELIRKCAAVVDQKNLVGSGEIAVKTGTLLVMSSHGVIGESRQTYGEVTVTARTRDGKGSGWGWGGEEDISHIDASDVTARAIDICERSTQPVAVEPGRYTVILEPQAAKWFLDAITGPSTYGMEAQAADGGVTVFSKAGGGNKIGLRMTDDRVQLISDPNDPVIPYSPLKIDGNVLARTEWISQGMLRNLAYNDWYARHLKRERLLKPDQARLLITGTPQTLEEMIASTKRGIWVHRFSGISLANQPTLLMSGVTRDGTFLIENGKVTKAIKNLRFLESPFFVLNKIDSFGPSVRASQLFGAPRIKAHDFEFTSLTDAV